MEEDYTDVNQSVGGSGRVTIIEAATLLGVHPNTIRGRVKAGFYNAEKVSTEYGLTWMIDRNSLINNPLPRDSQQPPSHEVNNSVSTPMELVQDLLRPFVEDLGKVREELGAERVRREQAEQERDELRRQLEAIQPPLDEPQGTQTASEEPESTETPDERPQAEPGVPQASPRSSWWRRWLGFHDREAG